jgi:hypothetical protein
MAGEEVDILGGGKFRGEHEVALVFTIFIIHEDDHAAVG